MRLRRVRGNMFENRAARRFRARRQLVLALSAVLALGWFFLAGPQDPDVLHELEAGEAEVAEEAVAQACAPDVVPASLAPVQVPCEKVEEDTVSPGDTASSLLGEFLAPMDLHNLLEQVRPVYPLSRLKAGQPYLLKTLEGALLRFEYEIDDNERLIVERSGDGYAARREAIQYELRPAAVAGRIASSLWESVTSIGENPALAVRLSEIFAWDIDFIRDIQPGDTFKVIVDKRYREGQFVGYGEIKAAEFVNQGDSFEAFLFRSQDGDANFFDSSGRNLRKAFLKAPLKFTRISSGFTSRRLHPVLGIYRAHPAIDYAAPSGTPVYVIGDGTVSDKGWDKGGGNFVKVRHANGYETTYMHLKGFARGLRKGQRLHQGQIIGYVGSTGLATGPHLDFRMKVAGRYVNPKTIKSIPAEPIPSKLMAAFKAHIAPLKDQLASAGGLLAQAAETDKPLPLRN
ncbi:MAG: peptidoglycan DD-metalloendopeptidase family protein [Thermodesulfobacteriota bacterium]